MDEKRSAGLAARGWNTWNTRSVLSHVLMPEALSISLGIKNHQTGQVIRESLIGRFGDREEQIHPGPRSYDGQYTALNWKQCGLEIDIYSTVREGELYLLVLPKHQVRRPPTLFIEAGLLWNRPGHVVKAVNADGGSELEATLETRRLRIFANGTPVNELNTGASGAFLAVTLDGPVSIGTGPMVSTDTIRLWVEEAEKTLQTSLRKHGEKSEMYSAMRTCMAWDTIYEPERDQVCSPVSRIWNLNWGGYVLFCWDTFFAAMMANLENPDLARANAEAIVREMTEDGFVPNFGAANDFKSRDRSQPPVGAMAVKEIFRRQRDPVFVAGLFDELLRWNRWWVDHRMTPTHTLCWGSDLYEPHSGAHWEISSVGDTAGAALESGLDNSPMYDDMPYDGQSHQMCLADVGLTGLYVMDCECLADLAQVLGRVEEKELRERAERVKDGLETLWDENAGMYLNRRTDTGEFSSRLSPTLFYALLSDKVSPERVRRMMKGHFYNPDEFWGDYIMPSIARNDPAYPEQDYWRGRIWAPMNFLVYLGLRKQGLTQARKDMSDKSEALFLKEWKAHGHVHENYDGDTGWGCGVRNSDKFYHWGALLALIAVMENEGMDGPEMPL